MTATEHIATLWQRFPNGIMLAETVTVTAGDAGQLRFLGERGFQVDGVTAEVRAWVAGLVEGRMWTDLVDPPAGCTVLLEQLAARGMLVPLPESAATDQLTKQRRWLAHASDAPDAAARRITEHRAVVIGCGGTGAIAATHLAAMGVGSMVLVDHDRVEVTNFNRQFTYRRRDIGRPKAAALRDFLDDRYPDCRIEVVDAFVDAGTADDVIKSVPAGAAWTAFCCADRPVGTLAAVVADLARRHRGSAIFAAAGMHEAAVGPLLRAADDQAHDRFAAEMADLADVAGSALAEPIMSASVAPVNTVTAAWMVSEWLYGVILDQPVTSTNRRFVVDLPTSRTTEERIWG